MGNIIKALLLIWELPQNIAGAFYFIIHGVFAKTFIIDDGDSFEMYSDKQKGGVSLGVFRVYKSEYYGNAAQFVKLTRKHDSRPFLPHCHRHPINNMGYPPFVLQAHKQD